MAKRQPDEYMNRSAQGEAKAGPTVRFGDYVVPSAVAWSRPATLRSPGVTAEFEMRNGRPFCVSVQFDAGDCSTGVRTGDLVALPGLDRKGVDAFLTFGTKVEDDDEWRAGVNLDRTSDVFNPDRKALAAALKMQSDDELDRVAAVYRANIERDPAGAVAKALEVSRATAARRIKEARDRGFLPKTSQGKKKG